MNVFNRAVRIFLIIVSVISAGIAAVSWFLSRMILSPPRSPVVLPTDDIPIEKVQFPAAQDGLRISGWYLPQARGEKAPVMIIVHGWPWNRTGEDNQDLMGRLVQAERVDLMALARSFHKDGYGVMMFDLRNHGESAGTVGGITFGLMESLDLLGAIEYLNSRSDVDMDKIGVAGFSMGANTALFAASRSEKIKAIAAIQPTTPTVFAKRMSAYMAGPLGAPILMLSNLFIKAFHGTPLEDIDLMEAASKTGKTPVLYIQGAGDQFGSVDDVQSMAARTPSLVDVIIPAEASNRYEGYLYAINNPEILRSYFGEYLNK
ncbi:MAG: alpha/beta fold hydrolase [Chloroflexota bacterium]